MKQRVITAIVALILFVPIVLMGGIWIDVLACAFAAVAQLMQLTEWDKILRNDCVSGSRIASSTKSVLAAGAKKVYVA